MRLRSSGKDKKEVIEDPESVEGKIKKVTYKMDTDGIPTDIVDEIIMEDDRRFTHKQIFNVFKNALRFNIAGEVLYPYDYFHYQKHISPKGLETHLQNVEAQARVDQMKLPNLSRKGWMAVGGIILIVILIFLAMLIVPTLPMFSGT